MNNNIDLGSFILQLLSLEILFKDFNNSDLMNELQRQDSNYLEKIVKQNKEILKILKERS
jgi:hypothetical protein